MSNVISAAMGFILLFALLAGPAAAGDPLSYNAQARALLERDELDRALDELKSGVSLYPYDRELKRSLVSVYVALARRELKLNHYPRAADYYDLARELAPDSAELGFMRGVALYLDKNYEVARAEFTLAGEGAKPLFYLGRIAYDTGDLPGALALWRRALEKEPASREIREAIAKAERELPVESKMDRGYSSMFDLSFDAELPAGLSARVLDTLESAYNSVGSDLGLFPTSRIPVLLYTGSDYGSVTAGPDWSGGLYDGKIRLPVGGVTEVTPQLRGTIFHEFTHVLIAQLTRGNVPTWLNEGLAEVEGDKEFRRPGKALAAAARDGGLLSLSTLSGSFAKMTGGEAGLAYQQSHSLARFLVSRFGWYAVQEILGQLGEGAGIESAFARALADWSLDLPGVLARWRQSLPAATK